MNTARIINLTLILTLTFLTGCQRVQTQKKMENFEKSITSYEVALRWAQHEDAYSYHVSPDGARPPVDLELLNELSVTGVDVLEKLVSGDETEGFVRMEVKYYFKDQGTVRKLKLEQEWWFNEENQQWFIKSDFPDFK